MSRQQRRFEARKGARTAGFTPVPRTRLRVRDHLKAALSPQYFEPLPNGGYRTLHHTKGWRTVSPKRLKHFPGAVA